MAHGPDGGLRPLPPLAHRPSARADLGLRYLRYGPPLHLIHRGPGQYDWAFLDEVAAEMQRLGIVPIMDLCHFGLPDWLQNFQNPEVPQALADYARTFAQRYPWVRLYTPVNEMYVCAKLSALEGVVERAMPGRARLRHRGPPSRQGQRPDDAGDCGRASGCRLRQQREQRVLPALLP